MTTRRREPEFPTDAEIEAVVARLRELLPAGVVDALDSLRIDVRDSVRFQTVASACTAAREKRGLTLKAAAVAIKAPQYRLGAVEGARAQDLDADVLSRYLDLLGLTEWFGRWTKANPELATRLAVPPSNRPRGGGKNRSGGTAPVVLEITVTLLDTNPPIWRRIQVPAAYSFYDLHVAIQDAMGWTDSHLHEFEVVDPANRARVRLGLPDDESPAGQATLPGWKAPIVAYLRKAGTRARYVYDFGDNWEHEIRFEGERSGEEGVRYPRCVAGERACPPEDCGSVTGFEEFLRAIGDPAHEEHESMLEWVGGPYDPAAFEPSAVRFTNPKRRLTSLLSGR